MINRNSSIALDNLYQKSPNNKSVSIRTITKIKTGQLKKYRTLLHLILLQQLEMLLEPKYL